MKTVLTFIIFCCVAVFSVLVCEEINSLERQLSAVKADLVATQNTGIDMSKQIIEVFKKDIQSDNATLTILTAHERRIKQLEAGEIETAKLLLRSVRAMEALHEQYDNRIAAIENMQVYNLTVPGKIFTPDATITIDPPVLSTWPQPQGKK